MPGATEAGLDPLLPTLYRELSEGPAADWKKNRCWWRWCICVSSVHSSLYIYIYIYIFSLSLILISLFFSLSIYLVLSLSLPSLLSLSLFLFSYIYIYRFSHSFIHDAFFLSDTIVMAVHYKKIGEPSYFLHHASAAYAFFYVSVSLLSIFSVFFLSFSFTLSSFCCILGVYFDVIHIDAFTCSRYFPGMSKKSWKKTLIFL